MITLYQDPSIAVAAAVAKQLQGMQWPCAITVRQCALPELDRESLHDQVVTVLLAAVDTKAERSARGSTHERPQLHFAVRSACRDSDSDRYQWLQSIAWTIGQLVLAMPKSQCADCTPQSTGMVLLRDVDRLKRGEFLTIRELNFTAQRCID